MRISQLQKRILNILNMHPGLTRSELYNAINPDANRLGRKRRRYFWVDDEAGKSVEYLHEKIEKYNARQASFTRSLSTLISNRRVVTEPASFCHRYRWYHGYEVKIPCGHKFPCTNHYAVTTSAVRG